MVASKRAPLMMLRGCVAAGRVTTAGLAAVLVGWLLLAAPVSAQTPPRDGTVFVYSAKSAKLADGRLTLLGGGPSVTWTNESGRSGVTEVTRMHQIVFTRNTQQAIGTLHVAGMRGGEELTFKLSQPRDNRTHHLVSYKATPLDKKSLLATRTGHTFGPASLTILPASASPTLRGAPQPSVAVQQTAYPCASDSSTTCWGTLLGSGLPPGSDLSGFSPQVPGNTGQGVDIDVQVDGNGNVNTQLNLLCNNPYGVTNPNVEINATSVTPSISVSAPASCG